jgi:iron complex transport system ATP-binding protein
MNLLINALNIKLKRKTILHDISAVCEPGKITVLLGPNGAGKSTLLRSLAGLITPLSGSITYGGQPVQDITMKQRACMIGLLSQTAQMHWDIDVRTLVALGRLPYRGWFAGYTVADSAAIEKAMQATDVDQFATRRLFSLSGGEQARAMLARVLAGEPKWLLADEPLAHLDLSHQLDVLQIFKDCAQNGCGIIMVLHDLHQAARIADHIILLSQGRVAAAGTAAQTLYAENIQNIYKVPAHVADQYATILHQ